MCIYIYIKKKNKLELKFENSRISKINFKLMKNEI